jgi:hypothetical protein
MPPVSQRGHERAEMSRQRCKSKPKVARIASPGVVVGNMRCVGALNDEDDQDEKLRQAQRF